MKDSTYQLAVYDFFAKNPLQNGMINAVAGSGKTTTLIKGLDRVNPSKPVLMCAFNKTIQEDFAKKITRPNTQALTANSFGHRTVLRSFKNIEFDKDKTRNILLHRVLRGNENLAQRMIASTKRIVSLAKANMIPHGADLHSQLEELCFDYNIEFPRNIPDPGEIVCRAFDECVNDTYHIDFDDQLFMPWRYNLPINEFALVIVDEYQDMSPIQSWMMNQAMGLDGSQIVAGDPWQAIYSWRGAMPDAMDKFKQTLNATELPLSICYRCPKSVVQEAQKIVKHIEPWDEAPEGIVDNCKSNDMFKNVVAGDFILCRTTAPLIEACLEFIKRGRLAQVRGRELGTDLTSMLEKIGGESVEEFIGKLSEYELEQSARLEALGKEQQLIELQDRVRCFKVLAETCKTLEDMSGTINKIFIENVSAGVTLMTAHRSKGLQSKNIYIIKPEQMPMKKANLAEEMRIKYVATTRAQEKLFYVSN